MKLSCELLKTIEKQYGESFYLLDSRAFIQNYNELLAAFRRIYPNSHIAYSYKTNYIPKLCKLVNQLGGMAEIVSDMEYKIALKVGVDPAKIMFNGPYKRAAAIRELLVSGGIVNIDSFQELNQIKQIAEQCPHQRMSVGLRCNFDIHDGVRSRFGFDTESPDFAEIIGLLRRSENITLAGLHCHFATRDIGTWPTRAENMLNLVQRYFDEPPRFISLGGGIFGKMAESLKRQFEVKIASYEEYAEAVTSKIRDFFYHADPAQQPKLIIEPGSALAGDVMQFVTKVINIKDVRGKKIATLLGSIYNINPTLNKKNPPIAIYHDGSSPNQQGQYSDLDFGGYTCIESDYLYRGFSGQLASGDFAVFDNVGSYSIVLKPPFILPNFPIVDVGDGGEPIELIKRQEEFEDLFKTFQF